MPRFLTLFPVAENVHLTKDVGMIPFILHKNHNYDSTLASYNNGTYPYFETEVKGLKHVIISKKFKNPIFDVLWFLVCNFWKYDVLQCYHFGRPSLLYLFFFKFLKKITFAKSCTYLKLDAVEKIKELRVNNENKILLKGVDLITVETIKIHEFLNANCTFGKSVKLITNGFFSQGSQRKINFELKKNTIITVGRIGDLNKNNEVLLDAFKKFSVINNDWNLELIGPIETEFTSYIHEYFEENPNLVEKVIFTGAITNRRVLEEKYNEAKVFILTSRSEGFPLVFLEAIKAGCTIITSKVTSAYDITNNEKYGAIFPVGDSDALVEQMVKVTSNNEKLKKDCEEIQDFAYANYSWNKISIRINELIQSKL